MAELDLRDLRDTFGRFMTGVTVVTTVDGNGAPRGFTANSFASVSLNPPMLLVCPGRFLSSFDVFAECEHFAVSVLAERQEGISNIFALRDGNDRFASVDWHPNEQGMPLITDAAAHFSCRRAQTVPAGDHVVLLGDVLAASHSGQPALGYSSGNYFSLTLEREAAAAPVRRAVAGVIVEYDGQVLLQETPSGYCPPHFDLSARARVREVLSAALAERGLDATLTRAYSVFDDTANGVHYHYFLAQTASDNTAGLGEYVDVNRLQDLKFVSPSHESMIARYTRDCQTRDFGLYVGDESEGDIY